MADWLSVLPNLSIGVVAVVALAYLSLNHSRLQKSNQDSFVKVLDERADKHEAAMREREQAMRDLEMSVRISMTDQLTKNTIALTETTRVMGRIVRHLDGENK